MNKSIITSDIKLVSVLLIFFVSLNVYGQVSPEESKDDWEVWIDKIPISGEIRVGVLEDFENQNLSPSSFYVLIPEKKSKMLCVEICSKDGRYKANREYKIDKLKLGSNNLIWPTKLKPELKNYKKRDLSILSSISESCEDDPEYYTLSSWSDNFDSDTSFSLLLKSEVPPSINITNKKEGIQKNIKCEKLELPPMITFDCKCDIPKNLLKNGSQITIKKRVRKINRVSYKRYSFPIKLPE